MHASYRDRVEVFAISPNGRLLGGRWINDHTFAIPGGGVDEGEQLLEAAVREFYEETGFEAFEPSLITGMEPGIRLWPVEDRKAKPSDRKHFIGSRTMHVVVRLLSETPSQTEGLDSWSVSDKGFYTPSEALAIQTAPGLVPMSYEHWIARKKIIERLREKLETR